jgi:hypothetical protein
MYHSVGLEQNNSTVDGDTLGIYSMTLTQFTAQIDAIQAGSKAKGLSIDVFGSAKNDSLSITFDDGYTDALTVIAPLLCARQIPFHVFVSSARMNGTDRKYLSPRQVVELSNMPGVTIGAHGATHRSLTSLSSSELAAELQASKSLTQPCRIHTVTLTSRCAQPCTMQGSLLLQPASGASTKIQATHSYKDVLTCGLVTTNEQ